jgi:asparagine synthase (glutamine-hydrolysing)
MCGIAGILGATDAGAARATVKRMMGIQAHRGPDGRRVREYPGAVLGHVRLAIIDLEDRSLQPFETTDGRWSIVFNGEIYNYLELRRELEDGFEFRTESDTEVLLAAYLAWGVACLSRLRGMFAFCIYDAFERRALLARDHFGQKPLHYATLGDVLVFASEVKGLIAAGLRPAASRVAWSQYLASGAFDHDPRTFFEGAWRLLPGEYAWVDSDGAIETHRYYDIRMANRPAIGRRDMDAAELRRLTAEVVALHTRADVPVGISLSGGFDSAAVLAGLAISGSLHGRTRAYSVVFPPDFSEERWMRQAAAHHDLELDLLEYTPDGFAADLAAMMYHLEGPIGGLMNCGLSRVVRAAREDGTIVLLGGMGLDEVFGGYRSIHEIYVRRGLRDGQPDAEVALAEYAHAYGLPVEAARQRLAGEQDVLRVSIDGTDGLAPGLLKPEIRELGHRASVEGDVQTALREYLQVSKIPRNMRMMDGLSMAFGVEYRSPFLDPVFVDYGLSLPVESYFAGGLTKVPMRRALADRMYPEVAWAAKRNVQAPQVAWLTRPPMSDFVRSLIGSGRFASRGYLDAKAAVEAFEAFCARPGPNSLFVWQWLNLELWHRLFVDDEPDSITRPTWSQVEPAAVRRARR